MSTHLPSTFGCRGSIETRPSEEDFAADASALKAGTYLRRGHRFCGEGDDPGALLDIFEKLMEASKAEGKANVLLGRESSLPVLSGKVGRKIRHGSLADSVTFGGFSWLCENRTIYKPAILVSPERLRVMIQCTIPRCGKNGRDLSRRPSVPSEA